MPLEELKLPIHFQELLKEPGGWGWWEAEEYIPQIHIEDFFYVPCRGGVQGSG
jgi:hypothetical protein